MKVVPRERGIAEKEGREKKQLPFNDIAVPYIDDAKRPVELIEYIIEASPIPEDLSDYFFLFFLHFNYGSQGFTVIYLLFTDTATGCSSLFINYYNTDCVL
jgi:hypothetical protein